MLGRVLATLLILLVVAHASINLVAVLPPFLVAENVVKAALYALGLYAVARGAPWAPYFVAVLASFGAGRVSRTVVDPYGRLGVVGLECRPEPAMALAHAPLVALELSAAVLAAAYGLRAVWGSRG